MGTGHFQSRAWLPAHTGGSSDPAMPGHRSWRGSGVQQSTLQGHGEKQPSAGLCSSGPALGTWQGVAGGGCVLVPSSAPSLRLLPETARAGSRNPHGSGLGQRPLCSHLVLTPRAPPCSHMSADLDVEASTRHSFIELLLYTCPQ